MPQKDKASPRRPSPDSDNSPNPDARQARAHIRREGQLTLQNQNSRMSLRGDSLPDPWNQLDLRQRHELKGKGVWNRPGSQGCSIRLLGCAIEKTYADLRREDPYERAFEDLIGRFDLYLSRINRRATEENREEQRGLLFLAQSSYGKTLFLLARRLQQLDTIWRSIHNITDIPLFAPAKDSRLLQYADFCANAIYGRYHEGLTGDFDKFASKFDREGGAVHGLSHLCTDSSCVCLACLGRQGRQYGLPPV